MYGGKEMKLSKKSLAVLITGMITVLLAGCTVHAAEGQGGFFQTYFVDPFTGLIRGIAEMFNGNYGLSIIIITLLIRLLLLPLMLRQYKNQQSLKEKMDLLKPEMEAIQKN